MTNKILLSLGLSLLTPWTAFAIPLPKGPKVLQKPPASYSQDYNFEGIVGLSNCSGSVIRFEDSKDTDAAVVLTNGHCLEEGMPQPGEVITNKDSNRRFNILDPQSKTIGRVYATKVMFSSMDRSDITLYRLGTTYAQIQKDFNVRPLTLSSQHPQINDRIEVVSGYWKMGYRCVIEQFVHELDEGGYKMFDSIRYSRPGCEVVGGTSGSPIIATGTRTVIGINNTGNESGESCTMNNPCEIDEKGKKIAEKGYSYGQQTYIIYSCLTADHEIDLSRPGCLLPH